jgi:hypothetical protein
MIRKLFDGFLRFSWSLSVLAGDFNTYIVYNSEAPRIYHIPAATSMLTKAIQNHGATLKRGLGLFLVVFIFYGTTVEAAHRHGRVLPYGSSATSLVDAQHTSAPSGSKIGCSDCLICQLQQHFNTTLLVFRVADPPAQVRLKISTALPRYVLSQVTGPIAGRAPPSIS